MSFTLISQELEDLNIAKKLENVFSHWEIKDKVTTVIRDNAKNVVNASLLQCCKTQWNSIYLMVERIFKNRCPISNVISPQAISSNYSTFVRRKTFTDFNCSKNY